jgi:hypothetical protein
MLVKMQLTVYAEMDRETYHFYNENLPDAMEAIANSDGAELTIDAIEPENWINNDECDEDQTSS